ncbi:MAG: hypothetical protein QOH19_1102 [Actinomycetota bacterium]|jgi:hypothetical protein|nr:hypothetical protein [Actinomycetota bacterium]
MTGKDSDKSGKSKAAGEADSPANAEKGFRSRLSDAQKEMLASKSRGGSATQSVGHSHKPTHASGKQGPAEKKVRW